MDIEKSLYLADGTKYDHRQDPWDCTGLCEAEPELKKQLMDLDYVRFWAITGRYRFTEAGFREMQRRKELIRQARRQGDIGPLLPQNEPPAQDL